MNLLKQNTDYAMRIMANLTRNKGGLVPTSILANEEDISPQFAAKIMQKLARAGLVESVMGKDGGFRLARKPGDISLYHIIEAVQGPIHVNKCSPGLKTCPHQPNCGVSSTLCEIETDIITKFRKVKLSDLSH